MTVPGAAGRRDEVAGTDQRSGALSPCRFWECTCILARGVAAGVALIGVVADPTGDNGKCARVHILRATIRITIDRGGTPCRD